MTMVNPEHIISPLKKNIFFLFVIGFIYNLMLFVYPIYMIQIYDKAIGNANKTTLIMLTILASTLTVLGGVFDSFRKYMLHIIALRVRNNTLSKLIQHQLNDFNIFNKTNTKESKIQKLDSLITYISSGVINTLFDLVWVPAFLIALYVIDSTFFLAAIISITLVLVANSLIEILNRGRHKEITIATENVLDSERVIFENKYSFPSRSCLDSYSGSVLDSQSEYYYHKQKMLFINTFQNGLQTTIRNLGQICVLALGAFLVIEGKFGPDLMIVATILYGRAITPIISIGNVQEQTLINYNNLKSLRNFLKNEQNNIIFNSPIPDTFNVSIEKLITTKIGGQLPMLKGLSLMLHQGDCIKVNSDLDNGSESLLRAIAGIEKPVSGKVVIAGHTTFSSNYFSSNQIRYVYSTSKLLPGTIYENISHFGTFMKEEVHEKCKDFGVHHLIMHLSKGYNTDTSSIEARIQPLSATLTQLSSIQ